MLVLPSKVKALVRVPETELAIMTISLAAPVLEPTVTWHATDVLDAHVAVEQACDAKSVVAVRSVVRKFKPVSVTMPPEVATVLPLATKLTTGAANVKTSITARNCRAMPIYDGNRTVVAERDRHCSDQ